MENDFLYLHEWVLLVLTREREGEREIDQEEEEMSEEMEEKATRENDGSVQLIT